MQLGNQNITAGDTRRYQIDYTPFLQPGEKLTGFTLAVAVQIPPATSTVNSAGNSFLDVGDTQLFLFVTGGVINENFTVKVQVVTNYGETVNDTIAFSVVAA
jgi:hypothetical protein